MCNQEQLIGYLYDDLSAAERAAFEAHLAACGECRAEIAGLQRTRQHLASWAPPEPEFNFRIVQSSRAATARRRFAFVPGWGLAAAAAVLVMAGAAAIANLEMRYGADGFVIRTGWASPAGTASAAPQASTPAVRAEAPVPAAADAAASEQLKATVALLTRRVQELERAQASPVARAADRSGAPITAPELRKILAETEARQRVEMVRRIEQVWNDFNATRAQDLLRVQQTVGPRLQRQERMLQDVMYRTTVK